MDNKETVILEEEMILKQMLWHYEDLFKGNKE